MWNKLKNKAANFISEKIKSQMNDVEMDVKVNFSESKKAEKVEVVEMIEVNKQQEEKINSKDIIAGALIVGGAIILCSELNRNRRIKRIEDKVDDIKNILYMFM